MEEVLNLIKGCKDLSTYQNKSKFYDELDKIHKQELIYFIVYITAQRIKGVKW